MTGNHEYFDKDGVRHIVVDPARLVAMEMLELNGMTGKDLGEGGFDELVEYMRDTVTTPEGQTDSEGSSPEPSAD